LGFEIEKLSVSKGVKINLIQGYEDWKGNVEGLHHSYDLKNIHNIVISNELKTIVKRYTKKPSFLLFNAVDLNKFKITNPVDSRNTNQVCMLYHELPLKGSQYGIMALIQVKKEIPDLKAILFGVSDKPDNLPDFVEYYKKPKNLCALYNRSAIYFTNSLQEGWGLPATEAMACGCTLICTNIGGHLDYANENTAVLVEPQNLEAMAAAIIDLITHPEKKIRLAKEGNRLIQQFSWGDSVSQLENYIWDLLK
jgi:glycosyltransferase involved in cell wall biosynthesis